MKQLFKVVDTLKGDKAKSTKTFDKKTEAKKFRDEQNSDLKVKSFRVGRAKDHWKGESWPLMSHNTEKDADKEGVKHPKRKRNFKDFYPEAKK